MITNINIGICQSRLQQNEPSFFINWHENGANHYKFSRSRFEIEQLKRKLENQIDMIKIKQKKYHNIEIDNREKDILILWGVDPKGKDSQILQIERENIPYLMEHLYACKKQST